MKWWLSGHWLVVTTPWNPHQITHYLPILSNLRQYPTQIRNGWAREGRCLGEWLDQGLRRLMELKRYRGFAGKGGATRDLVAVAHSPRESLGSEGWLRTMDRSEGRIHYRGHVVSLPQRSALTQNTLPPHLCQVRWEGWKQFLSLYSGKSLDFSLVS